MNWQGIEFPPEKYMSREQLAAFRKHLAEPQYWFRCPNGHAFWALEPDVSPNCLTCNEVAAADAALTKWHADQRARRLQSLDSP